jgi:hypothetical protein
VKGGNLFPLHLRIALAILPCLSMSHIVGMLWMPYFTPKSVPPALAVEIFRPRHAFFLGDAFDDRSVLITRTRFAVPLQDVMDDSMHSVMHMVLDHMGAVMHVIFGHVQAMTDVVQVSMQAMAQAGEIHGRRGGVGIGHPSETEECDSQECDSVFHMILVMIQEGLPEVSQGALDVDAGSEKTG